MRVLQTVDLKKYYGEEPNITRALDGVNFSVDDGEFVAVVGTVRQRQIYLAAHDRRAGHAHFRQRLCAGQRLIKDER